MEDTSQLQPSFTEGDKLQTHRVPTSFLKTKSYVGMIDPVSEEEPQPPPDPTSTLHSSPFTAYPRRTGQPLSRDQAVSEPPWALLTVRLQAAGGRASSRGSAWRRNPQNIGDAVWRSNRRGGEGCTTRLWENRPYQLCSSRNNT